MRSEFQARGSAQEVLSANLMQPLLDFGHDTGDLSFLSIPIS